MVTNLKGNKILCYSCPNSIGICICQNKLQGAIGLLTQLIKKKIEVKGCKEYKNVQEEERGKR